jgi:transposase-like protein
MPRRIFANKAKRAWWSVHVEAWRQSGLTASAYCRLQNLPRHIFKAWQAELAEWEAQKAEERQRWKRRHGRISPDKRRKATQAFWAMHVEAWQWSGLHLRDYASSLRLSPYSLKRWRNLIESEEITIDWRAMLHPSSRPLISTNISTRTKEAERAEVLTAAIEAEAGPPKRATRRRYSTEQKIALLLETERHGESVSSVGRAHGIATSVLFRWRDQFGFGKEKPAVLVPVRVIEDRSERSGGPSLLADLLQCPDGMMEVELADGRRVFAPVGADPDEVRREISAREVRP